MFGRKKPGAGGGKHCHGFFSHAQANGKDIGIALRLEMKQVGLELWIDQKGVDVGDWLDEKVKKAVQDADLFILFVAENVFQHRWVRFELLHAIRAQKPILLMKDPDQPFSTKPVDLFSNVPQGYHECFSYLFESLVWMNYERADNKHEMMLEQFSGYLRNPDSACANGLREKLSEKLGKKSWESLESTAVIPELLPKDIKLFDVNFDVYRIALEKADEFEAGTREWMFDRFLEFSERSNSTRAFIVHGGAGVGKSCVAAELVRRAGGIPARMGMGAKLRKSLLRLSSSRNLEALPFDIAALHFFRYDDTFLRDGRACLFSFSNQLAQNVPGYALALGDTSRVRWDETDLGTMFRLLVVDPCLKLDFPPRQKWIILDALDECASGQRSAFIDMLRSMWLETPDWLRLLVTTRPEARIPEKLGIFEPEEINTDDERNTKDMEVFLRRKLKRRVLPEDLEKAVGRLLRLSSGLFLYARFVEHTLREVKGSFTLDDLVHLFPEKNDNISALDAVFARYFKRLREIVLGKSEELYIALIAPLVAARSPLPTDIAFEIFLAAKPNLKLSGYKKLVQNSQLLVVDEEVVRFVHKSMSDWLEKEVLEESENYSRLQEAGHELLADSLPSKDHLFAFDHCVYHQACAGAELRDTVEEFGWLGRALLAHEDRTSRVVWLNQMSGDILRSGKCVRIARILGAYAGVLSEYPEQLGVQLLGRLHDESSPLFDEPEKKFHPGKPWLKPLYPSMQEPESTLFRTFRGHDEFVSHLLQDQDTLVSGSYDGTVRVWNLVDSTVEGVVLRGHSESVLCVATAHDGIASGSVDETVVLWNRRDLTDEMMVLEAGSIVASVAMTESLIAAGCSDGKVRIWDRADLSKGVSKTLEGHSGAVHALHSDETRLISGSPDKTVNIWNLRHLEAPPRVLTGHAGGITSLAVAGSVLLTASNDKTIRVWNLDNLDEKPAVLRGHTDYVFDVSISGRDIVSVCCNGNSLGIWDLDHLDADPVIVELKSPTAVSLRNNRLLVGCADGSIQFWDFAKLRASVQESKPNPGKVIDAAMEGNTIVTCALDDTGVRVWDASRPEGKPRVLWGDDSDVFSVTLSGDLLASGTKDGAVMVWDAQDLGKAPCVLLAHDKSPVMSVRILDSGHLATLSREHMFVWHLDDLGGGDPAEFGVSSGIALAGCNGDIAVATDRDVRVFNLSRPDEDPIIPKNSSRYFTHVAINKNLMVAGSIRERDVFLWRIDAFEEDPVIFRIEKCTFSLEIVDTSVIVGDVHIIRIFDAEKPSQPASNVHADSSYNCAMFYTSGHLLTAGPERIRVWDWETRAVSCFVGVPMMGCHSLASDGEIITAFWEDGSVRMWSFDGDYRRSRLLTKHKSPGSRVEIMSNRVISCSDDWTVHVCDISTRPVVLNAHEDAVEGIGIDAQSKRFASGSRDGTIKLWNVDSLEFPEDVIQMDSGVIELKMNCKWLVASLEDSTVCIMDRQDLLNRVLIEVSNSTHAVDLDGNHLVVSDFVADIIKFYEIKAGPVPNFLMEINANANRVSLVENWLISKSFNCLTVRKLTWRSPEMISKIVHQVELDFNLRGCLKIGNKVLVGDEKGNVHTFQIQD